MEWCPASSYHDSGCLIDQGHGRVGSWRSGLQVGLVSLLPLSVGSASVSAPYPISNSRHLDSVHAVFPHTAHRHPSPAAFGCPPRSVGAWCLDQATEVRQLLVQLLLMDCQVPLLARCKATLNRHTRIRSRSPPPGPSSMKAANPRVAPRAGLASLLSLPTLLPRLRVLPQAAQYTLSS